MARETFTYRPEWESTLSQEPAVTSTKFGDGYEARVAKGINNSPEVWTLQFSATSDSIPAILTFLRDKAGVTAFYWENPFRQQYLYVCRRWKMTRKAGMQVLNVEFEQVFEV